MRTFIIILISKVISFILRIIGRGSSMPGKVALFLDKKILNKIQLPEDIIVVTGSNGKTTTVEMIYNIFKDAGIAIGYNQKGSNQIEGATTMILDNCTLSGKCKKDVLLLESDERYLRQTLKFIKAKYLVITNLYRDQMTRNGHPEIIYDIIKEAIDNDVHLILNTDDPLSSLYGYKRKNVTYYGINENQLSKKENTSAYNDGIYCPNCKSKMHYDYYHYSHIGKYKCDNCGHERKNPQYAVTNMDLKTGKISINKKYEIEMSFHSFYNAYNTLAAFAVSNLYGIEPEKISESLTKYIAKNGRVQTFELNGHKSMLLTSKHENSISYNQSLSYIVNQKEDCTVVLIIDAVSRKYFTSETSWIWDIDFELLNDDCVKKIILAGKYSNDLAIRFQYGNIGQDKLVIKEDLDEMMEETKNNAIGNIYVVTCFSDRMKFMDRR